MVQTFYVGVESGIPYFHNSELIGACVECFVQQSSMGTKEEEGYCKNN